MKKEYTLVFIVGLFFMSYILDAAVNPLTLKLATPYQYFNSENIARFPFVTTSIVIKSLALFLTPLWLFSLVQKRFSLKGIILLITIFVMQLYALQDIITGNQVVPIEWSLPISIAGIALLVPTVTFIARAALASRQQPPISDVPRDHLKKNGKQVVS